MKEKLIARRGLSRVVVAATVLGLAVGGTLFFKRGASAQPEDGTVGTVTRGSVRIAVQEVGSVEAFRKVDLKSKISGQVSEVLVDVGNQVKAGDVLVRLDPRDAKRELAQLQARHIVNEAILSQSSAQLGIQKRALSEGGISKLEVTKTEGDVKRFGAQLSVDAAEQAIVRDRIGYTELRAPIDGVVLARNVQPGEMVTPGVAAMVDGKPLLVIAQVEKLLVRAEMNQIDVVRLRPDQSVKVKMDALPEHAFEGHVYRIAAMAQRSERRKDSNLMVFPVDVIVDASQKGGDRLRPGMMADIAIDLGSHDDVLNVPLEAVVREGEKTKLRRLDAKGKEQLVDVVVGYQNEQVVEILSGIDEGTKIRVRGSSAK